MTSEIYLSVVRAWRFADAAGQTAVTHDLTEHRARIATLHGGGSVAAFGLPWVPFRSNYWRSQLGRDDYETTPPTQLVGALVPLRATFGVDYHHPATRRRPLAEVYLEPFGLWSAVTVDLTGGKWGSDEAIADGLSMAMTTDVQVGTAAPFQLRDGLDVATIAELLDIPPWSAVDQTSNAGRLVVTSGLCPADVDVGIGANQLRSHFLGGANAIVNLTTRSRGATATTSDHIGIALTEAGDRAGARIKCLHHNHTLLFGHLLSFSAVVGANAPAVARRYQDMAARLLNYFGRGEPFPTGGIYKSRATTAWFEKRGLQPVINAATDRSPDGPLPHV